MISTSQSHLRIRYKVHFSFILVLCITIIGHISTRASIIPALIVGIIYYGTFRGVKKLQDEVEKLETIAVQCAWCGKIRTAGEFTSKVSHSICPDCMERELSDNSCIHITSHGL